MSGVGTGVGTLFRASWRGDLRYLLGGRALRSVTQGYLGVIVPLFLVRAGYDTVQIGVLLTVAAASGAVLTALVGFGADRWGRKPLLVALGLMTAAGGAVFALTTNYVLLLTAAALGTVGRGGAAGSGGAFGPYYPAEQALIAEHASDRDRTTVFAGLSLVGVLAAAVGASLAAVPRFLVTTGLGSRMEGFHLLFGFTVLVGIAMAIVVLPVTEAPRTPQDATAPKAPPRLSHRTRGLLLRFAITNSINGLAVGFLGPILALWFHLRYGVDAAAIGVLYVCINLVAVVPYVGVPWIARRLGGVVRTVVTVRLFSASLLAVIPFMPTFVLAGGTYLVRMMANAVSIPVRQSYVMGIVQPAERSRVAALSNLPARVFSLAGPTLAGAMLRSWWIGFPLEIASALQLGYSTLYWRFFRNVHPPEELPAADG
jgi:MFS family permease